MQRPFRFQSRLFGIFVDVIGDAFDQRMFQAFAHRPLAPFQIFLFDLAAAAIAPVFCRQLQQFVGAAAIVRV